MSGCHSLPNHHPSDALLLAYAAGSLTEGLALAVATHLALCPACRHAAAEADALGGCLLETLEPMAMGKDALARALACLDDAPRLPAGRGAAPVRLGARTAPLPLLPEPLRSAVGPLGEGRWQRIAPGAR